MMTINELHSHPDWEYCQENSDRYKTEFKHKHREGIIYHFYHATWDTEKDTGGMFQDEEFYGFWSENYLDRGPIFYLEL